MKLYLLPTLSLAALFSSNVFALDVRFANDTWNGVKIPEGQQCQKFGGNNPATPKWLVSDIPAGSDSILFEYSDRDSEKMNNGGHGRIQYRLDATDQPLEIPSVPGHSFDLPQGFSLVEAHRSPGWDKAGAYMPPCSGGKGHAYYVTVKTLQGDKVTAETVIELGTY
ncbi:hypothetical protein [Sedimenticola thiotaurini]|uniref:YbhB/YbcL family Raf kinase inhibitor-like protein n=1 Tax=Sedimenticola thiotaurini TaxID=1543721 RepID=A0A0F7K3T9_9GAMM|nr:hypothetical protein [Sedimenticola thiotaurini]AKH21593.1 hypothetical protein AAY24_15885 [Sedimenticola thiotaurini]